MNEKNEIISTLKKLNPEVTNTYKARLIGIFGSRARGDNTLSSDIDILVEFNPGADLIDYMRLASFLEEKLDNRIDLVPHDAIRSELRDKILKEAEYLK
ncbi:MAG: hypothetical protein A2096_07175 [Spirochaetes bacterium GWF1_41_5]|nr:MAG: hypothetical protein A2096_07175 [Spirochaetes bacterium GWF1_41_5]HBE04611.1 nucleotidyltransferase [Spirochaetia bacterium]